MRKYPTSPIQQQDIGMSLIGRALARHACCIFDTRCMFGQGQTECGPQECWLVDEPGQTECGPQECWLVDGPGHTRSVRSDRMWAPGMLVSG